MSGMTEPKTDEYSIGDGPEAMELAAERGTARKTITPIAGHA